MEFDEPFPELMSTTAARVDDSSSEKKNKTWEDILQVVKQSRKLQSNLTSKIPNFFTFFGHDSQVRLYFIGVPDGKKDNTIMFVDVNFDGKPVSWKEALKFPDGDESDSTLSKEEQLLLERQRLSLRGITNFIVDKRSGRLVFQAASKLHTCLPDPKSDSATAPKTLDTVSTGSKLNPQICPQNSDFVAYVSNGDIWVYDLFSNTDHRLTYSCQGTGNASTGTRSSGQPSYVIQEEFERFSGYWWSPCEAPDGLYRILYEEVDESDVDLITILSGTSETTGAEHYRYPRAGTRNAVSTIKLIEISYQNGQLTSHTLRLYSDLKILYPWMEYVVRLGWMSDSTGVWVQLVDRSQSRIALVLIPLSYFVYDDKQSVPSDSLPHTLHEEYSQVWINVHNCLQFIPPGASTNPNLIQFVWASENTGFAHLYLCSYDTSQRSSHPPQPLTFGEWQVYLDQPVQLDLTKGLVYFMANKDTPLESHLYYTSLANGHINRLTQPGFTHKVTLNETCNLVVSTFSSVETNPSCRVYKVVQGSYDLVALKDANVIVEPSSQNAGYIPPQILKCPLDYGRTFMYAMVYKPHNYQAGKKYPTVLFVYGGPHLQLVTNSNKAIRMQRLHTLAALGYVVVCLDGRGSSGRGVKWESRLKNCMGTVEINDQVEGLQWLAKTLEYIDLNRVAIHGWSYGGYISLMGLIQRPDIFKLAISCAPVTKWEYYDTGYTERYMSKPDQNPDGYKNGSVLNLIDKFPNQENRLLLVHGMIDENVHLIHTTTLVNELIKACKPHQLQLYPNERHGIRNSESNQHFETMVIRFLQDNM